jgi:hypothetical protein
MVGQSSFVGVAALLRTAEPLGYRRRRRLAEPPLHQHNNKR